MNASQKCGRAPFGLLAVLFVVLGCVYDRYEITERPAEDGTAAGGSGRQRD